MTDKNQRDTSQAIRFTSWNVRGLGGPIKRTKVLSHLKSLKTDTVFLQETHLSLCDHTRLRKPWVGKVFHSSFNDFAQEVQLFYCISEYSFHQNRSYLTPTAVISLLLVCCFKFLSLWFVYMPPTGTAPILLPPCFLPFHA